MCKKNGKVFLDNGNISNMDLYQDGLHLPERGKCLLAKNFIFVLNIFLNMLTSPFSRYKAPLDCSEKTDLQRLQDLRLHHRKNPFIGYLNINSLRNEISDLRVLLHDLQLEYFVISETKLDDSFPSAQFAIENYKIRARRGRDGHRGGLIGFVKRGINCKRVNQFKTVVSESICSEITISRKKWFCVGICRPPNFNNLDAFFKEVSDSLSKASLTYKNFIITGDFNININTAGMGVDKLDYFLIPSLIKNNFIYSFITPSQTGLIKNTVFRSS